MKNSPSKVKNGWNFTIGTLQEVRSLLKTKQNKTKQKLVHRVGLVIPVGNTQAFMAMHPFSNTRLSVCSLESMSAQTYPLISIYEYVLFVSHHYPKKKRKEKKALIQTTLTLTWAQDFFQTPNVLGSQMVAWSQGWKEKKMWWLWFSGTFSALQLIEDFAEDLTAKKGSGKEKENKMCFQPDSPGAAGLFI